MEDVNPLLSKALDFLRQGDIGSAETKFGDAVSACCEAYGEASNYGLVYYYETDIVTARTLAHLARVSSLRGKKDIACQMYERILRIHEALPEPLNCDHAIALSELAVIREENGYSGADVLRGRADGIMKELSSRKQAPTNEDETDSSENSSSNESSSEDGDQAESSSSDGPGDTTPTTTAAGSLATEEKNPVRV